MTSERLKIYFRTWANSTMFLFFLIRLNLCLCFLSCCDLWQAALDKGKSSEKNDTSSVEDSSNILEPEETVTSQMNELNISSNSSVVNPPSNSTESLTPVDYLQDIDKKIRALKKKVKLQLLYRHD